MMKLLNAILEFAAGPVHDPEPVRVRRQSVLFPEGRRIPAYCHHDTARHRQHHHYYEDLLS